MQKWIVRLALLFTCVENSDFDFSLPPEFHKPHDFEDDVTQESCSVGEPPFPVNKICLVEEIKLLQGIYAASGAKKGVHRILFEDTDYTEDHIQLWVYLTQPCSTEDCAIVQRISTTGQLLTPQLYLNQASQLLILVYGHGQGRVLTFDKPLALYTWQQITLSISDDELRVCVRSAAKSHCHLFQDVMMEYQSTGPWTFGGTAHKHSITGLIMDAGIIPEMSNQAELMKDLNHINKPVKHNSSPLSISLHEMFMLCKAYTISGIVDVRNLSDKHYRDQCSAPTYPPCTTCNSSDTESIESTLKMKGQRRILTEVLFLHGKVQSLLDCKTASLNKWYNETISNFTFPFSKLGKEFKRAGELALSEKNVCGGVTMLLSSGCYGDPETFFTLSALFSSGVLLPQNLLLADQLTLGAAIQGSTLANLALASKSSVCSVKFAYHGAVAEQFMKAWKIQDGDDLVTDRTRLHHGEMASHTGEDDQVFQFLLMQANQGDADAQANVGRMYYWGQGGVARNINEAFNMQQQAALQNHPDAMFDTGIMLMKGQGTEANTTKAREFLKKAAKVGHKGAYGTLGYLELNERNNVTGAVYYFNHSHTLGDTDATHNLAVIHTYFKQFDPDPLYGHKMFKLAADKGHKDAALVSAEQCLQGFKNISGDCEMALMYIKKLSDSSHLVTKLMKRGVKLYQEGRYDDSFLNYVVLAEAGVEEAQYNAAWLCQEYDLVYAIPNCSLHYYNLSAQQGYGPSQVILANHLWIKMRFYEAARWYARAAQSDIMEGLFGLAYIAQEGIPVGTVPLNSSHLYFGPRQNVTLAQRLYSQCFNKTGHVKELEGTGHKTLFEYVWWSLITITTIGYGQTVIESNEGKIVGGLCAIAGVPLFAIPIPIISKHLERVYRREMFRKEYMMRSVKMLAQGIPIDDHQSSFDEDSFDSEDDAISWKKLAGTRRKSMGAHFGMEHFSG